MDYILKLVVKGESEPQELKLEGQRITVGRDPGNQIAISETYVSSRHAIITITDEDEILLEDCDSANGTFLNNVVVLDDQFDPLPELQEGHPCLAGDPGARSGTACRQPAGHGGDGGDGPPGREQGAQAARYAPRARGCAQPGRRSAPGSPSRSAGRRDSGLRRP